jgi:hypothetical protein
MNSTATRTDSLEEYATRRLLQLRLKTWEAGWCWPELVGPGWHLSRVIRGAVQENHCVSFWHCSSFGRVPPGAARLRVPCAPTLPFRPTQPQSVRRFESNRHGGL